QLALRPRSMRALLAPSASWPASPARAASTDLVPSSIVVLRSVDIAPRLNRIGLEHRADRFRRGLHVRVLLHRLARLAHTLGLVCEAHLRPRRPRGLARGDRDRGRWPGMLADRLLEPRAHLLWREHLLVLRDNQLGPPFRDASELAVIGELAGGAAHVRPLDQRGPRAIPLRLGRGRRGSLLV